MDLSIKIWQKNNEFVASCPELDVHCFGPNKEKASNRLKSVIEFYFDSAQDMNDFTLGDDSPENIFKTNKLEPVTNSDQTKVH